MKYLAPFDWQSPTPQVFLATPCVFIMQYRFYSWHHSSNTQTWQITTICVCMGVATKFNSTGCPHVLSYHRCCHCWTSWHCRHPIKHLNCCELNLKWPHLFLKLEALTRTSDLASAFLHPPLDFWWNEGLLPLHQLSNATTIKLSMPSMATALFYSHIFKRYWLRHTRSSATHEYQ